MPTNLPPWLRRHGRRLIALPILLAGAVALALLVRTRPTPDQREAAPEPQSVRVIEVGRVDVLPRVLGFGTARPAQVWEAVAQVEGRIVEMHPELRAGSILTSGTLLARIDPTDIERRIAQTEARIESLDAELDRLAVEEENIRAALEIERRSLELGEANLERTRTLVADGTTPRSELDREQRDVLAQRSRVQTQQNALRLVPAQRRSLQAQREQARVELEQARIDLSRTEIHAPFDGRLARVGIELTQFVTRGAALIEMDSVAVTEVPAQIPPDKLQPLLNPEANGRSVFEMAARDMREAVESLGFTARVRLAAGGIPVTWEARLARMSDLIDRQTRTVGVIVAVDDTYRQARPGVRPPLVKGMFCEVEIRGQVRPGRIVVPRTALHEGQVYVVDGEQRLRRRPVEVEFMQSDFVVIGEGLQPGERIVISDVIPAIDGMPLSPTHDAGARARLIAQATGEAPLR